MKQIEVFADVACPFTHVGLRRLVDRRARLGRDDVVLRVRAWPLELVNGAPLQAELIDEEVRELREQVAPDLFAGFDPGAFPSTSVPALALAAFAYGRGSEVGERVSLALRHALFEEGRDISDPEVLLDVATSCGIGLPAAGCRDEVEADWREGQERGVIGSPHFFVGGVSWFCPTLDISRVDEHHLEIRRDDESVERFLATVFA